MPLFAISTYHFKSIAHIPLPHCCYSSSGHPPPLLFSFAHTYTHTGHARTYARTRAFQQRCCFFAVTSVTGSVNLGGKTSYFLDNGEEKKKPFSVSSSLNVLLLNHAFVKTHLNKNCIKLKYNGLLHPLWHFWQQKCKNSWQERARTRARKGVYRYFHNSNVPFPVSISELRISRLLPLYWKQHVSFNKTTRQFQ